MSNILEKIIADKKKDINEYKSIFSVDDLKKKIALYKNYLNFKNKLTSNKISVIAEIKKASPSAGIIIENYDPKSIAKQYEDSGAACLSVLTEKKYFKGKLEHITEIKKEVKLPVLCKDFFIDPYQIYLAKSFGADAILIILSAINEEIAKKIYNVANDLDISTIIEVHTNEEAKKALYFENAIIGINNRNLKTLKTNISTTYDLHKTLVSHTGPIISESGISTEKEVEEIVKKTKIKNFLIGESLLRNIDKNSSLLQNIIKINP